MIDIDVDLVFCNDSILRVKSYRHDKEIYYPLLDLQSYYQEDASFIIRVLNQKTFFEKNTTLANAILALEPWQDFLSKYTDRDVDAYCVECKKPSDAKQAFSWLNISKYGSLSRHYQYRPMGDDEDIDDYLNSHDCWTETSLFNVEDGVHMSGVVEGENEQYSMSSIPFSEIKHTAITIENNKINTILEKEIGKSVGEVHGFTVDKNGIVTFHSPAEFTFEEVISAIFVSGLFYRTPMTGKQYLAFNKMMMDATEEVENARPSLSLVNEGTQPDEEEENHLTISIAPGAFDGLANYESAKTALWDDIHTQLASTAKLKIGCLVVTGEDSQR